MQQYAWFIWSSIALIFWILIYFSVNREKKKEMLVFSLLISLFGLTQPLWVPEYWRPLSIIKLPFKFDIESIIFSFGTGGITVAVYSWAFPSIARPIIRNKYLLLSLFLGPVVFIIFLFAVRINHIYSAIIAMTVGGLFSYFLRPELRRRMLVSATFTTVIYFGYFLLLVLIFPGYIEKVWNLKNISGVLITGVPLEELIFAASLGFIWPSIYEYARWLMSVKKNSS